MIRNKPFIVGLIAGLGGFAAAVPSTPAEAFEVPDARPHVLWEYTFRDNGDPYNPLAERYYFTCVYIGPHGEISVHADNGRCAWLKLFGATNEGVIRQRPWE